MNIRNRGRNDVHFTCVGGGPSLVALRAMVKEKNLDEMVNFTGRVPERSCSKYSRLPMSA